MKTRFTFPLISPMAIKPTNTIDVVSKLKLSSLSKNAAAFTSIKATCQTYCA